MIRSPWTAAAFSLIICAVAWTERDSMTSTMKTVFAVFLLLNIPYIVDGMFNRK